MTDFKSFRTNLEEKKGLWDNIHAKRKRGEKPNPPGHPDRPTAQDFKDAQKKESVEEKKTANEAKDGDGANIVRDREFKGKKLSSQPRAKPGDKGFNSYDKLFKKGGQKPAWMDREKMKKESLDISEISLDMLTKKISNSGMATTKKANKMDKTKNDLAAMKARLAGKPAMAKEAYEDDEPASPDEASMAMRQLGFIEYAAEEVMDHIKSGKEFPEWMQNKLSKLHGQMESLHSALGEHGEDDEEMKEATELDELNKKTLGSYVKKASRDVANRSADNARDYAKGNRPVGMNKKALKNWKREIGIDMAIDKMTKEEVANEALSNNMRLISKIKNSGVVKTGSMAKDTKPAPKKEVDEAKRKGAPKMTGDSVAIQRAKDAALNKALGRTKTGRKTPTRTMTSTQRSLASLRNEGVNTADKKPEKFVKPDGTVGIRMVPVDKQIVDKDK